MSEYIKIGLRIIWLIFLTYWIISALGVKTTVRTESFLKRFAFYWLPLIVAFVLLGPGDWYGTSWFRENFVPHIDFVGILGLSISAAGLVTACWARYLLGTNWSATVQQKADHALITSGPYRFVRHPIYTGLLLIFTGHALIVGDYRAIIAVIIVFVSFWFKLKKEEALMEQIFGGTYEHYRRNTKALVPGIL